MEFVDSSMNEYNSVIVVDLDGTLLTDNKTISNSSVSFLTSSSFNIVLASGRHIEEMIPYAKILEPCVSFLISCDGCYVFNRAYEKVFENKLLNSLDAQMIHEITRAKKMLLVCDKQNILICDGFIESIKRVLGVSKSYKTVPCGIEGIEKIRIQSRNISKKQIDNLSKYYSSHIVFNEYIDIKATGVNKFSAINYLCKMLNIDMGNILYFGDDLNDIECFENIKHCVAMNNASEEIKQKAEYVTTSNNDDGVIDALKYYKTKGII